MMIRNVQVRRKGMDSPDYEGIFLGWGVKDGTTIAIIEKEELTVEMVDLGMFKFQAPLEDEEIVSSLTHLIA